jgi:DNA-binding transcriptional LysR family regulator
MQLHAPARPFDLLRIPHLTESSSSTSSAPTWLPDSSLVAVQLGTVEQHIVASPAYLRAKRAPKTPAHLAEHECLLFGLDGPTLRARWTLVSGKRKTDVAVRGRFATDDLLALRAAALTGLGLARLPRPMIAADLEAGALVSVLNGFTSVPTPLHLVHAGGRLLPARTRALIDFLVERMTDSRGSVRVGLVHAGFGTP